MDPRGEIRWVAPLLSPRLIGCLPEKSSDPQMVSNHVVFEPNPMRWVCMLYVNGRLDIDEEAEWYHCISIINDH